MNRRMRSLPLWNKETILACLTPGFLLLALVLGGASREAPLPNLILQAAAIFVIAGAIVSGRLTNRAWSPLLSALVFLVLAAAGVGALQLIPLPAYLWLQLPGRESIAAGFSMLGLPLPNLPVSLAPNETLLALGGFLPPLAVLALGLALSWRVFRGLLRWAIVLMACAACLFGLAQAFLGQSGGLYLYASTNLGWPVGFFANVNHQATLMLMALPFLAAAASHVRFGWAVGDRDMGLAAFLVAAAGLLTVGVITAGSEFGYWLFGPIVGASILVYRGQALSWKHGVVATGISAVLVCCGFLLWNSSLFEMLGLERPDDLFEDNGRALIFKTTWEAIQSYWPMGSGLGSFEQAYPGFEDPSAVTNSFVNMAHNEYLQILMEYGVAGAIILICGILWWGVATAHVWLNPDLDDLRLRRAGSVALGVALLHSFVDYPMRTAAIASLAMACALIMTAKGGESGGGGPRRKPEADSSPSKLHVDI
jgi:hypothetical protein